MALYTPDLATVAGNSYGALTIGDTPTPITPNVSGDSIALVGNKVGLWFVTTGTAITVTYDSVRLSDQGQDTNITSVLPATGVRRAMFDSSGDRFKQTSGNVGYLNLTYTAITGLTIYAWYTN